MPHPIENIMKATMEQLREMVDVNTIVGSPIVTGNNTTVLPVSKVCLGFVSGGGEYRLNGPVQKSAADMQEEEHLPFAGTAVAGISLTPVGFVAVDDSQVRMLPAKYNGTWDHVIEALPRLLETVCRLLQQEKAQEQQDKTAQ